MAQGDSVGLYPYLVVNDAAAAIDFYTRAFGAEEVARHAASEGDKLMHVRMNIFGSSLLFADDFSDLMGGKTKPPKSLGGTTVTLHLHVDDAQAVWDQALAAGATISMPLADQFWGERYGKLWDPFGHEWSLGQTLKEVGLEEFEAAAKEHFPS